MAISADPDEFLIYTVCKGRVYPGSEGQGLKQTINILLHIIGETFMYYNIHSFITLF